MYFENLTFKFINFTLRFAKSIKFYTYALEEHQILHLAVGEPRAQQARFFSNHCRTIVEPSSKGFKFLVSDFLFFLTKMSYICLPWAIKHQTKKAHKRF